MENTAEIYQFTILLIFLVAILFFIGLYRNTDALRKSMTAEQKIREEEHRRSTWISPLVIAIIAATIAAFSNAGVTYYEARTQRVLDGDVSRVPTGNTGGRDQQALADCGT